MNTVLNITIVLLLYKDVKNEKSCIQTMHTSIHTYTYANTYCKKMIQVWGKRIQRDITCPNYSYIIDIYFEEIEDSFKNKLSWNKFKGTQVDYDLYILCVEKCRIKF